MNTSQYATNLTDLKFKNMCNTVLSVGFSSEGQNVRPKWKDGTPAHTIKTFGIVNQYDLAQEFPILTLRPIPWKKALDEILWIWQKKSNNINELNSHIWDSWANKDGSIGKAYGYQLGVKHNYPEGQFDQVDKVLYDLTHNPYSRRIMTNMYVHQDLNEMNLHPCCYSCTFNVSGNKLNMMLNQRSQDILTANGWNVTQYALLLHMIAQSTGLLPGILMHVIADAHIYDRHVPLVKELINRGTYAAPKLEINPDVKNFYDFTVDDFKLHNYKAGKQIKIPVAI